MWKKGIPKKAGNYWFYSYRYGKVSCGRETEPEMMFMKVRKIANGLMHTADGQFVFEQEVEEPYYIKAELPDPPY